MKQTYLPLCSGAGTTYTQLARFREEQYRLRGPGLVREALQCLEELEIDPKDLKALINLNDVTLELGALALAWFDFSVAVFTALLSISPASIGQLRPAFLATLVGMAPTD